MTIGTNTARVSFNCNGVTPVFPVAIQAYSASDFLVLATNTTTGAVTTLVLNSDYTLAASGTLAPTAWTLTTLTSQLTSPYATGITLQVILNPAEVQQTQYVQGQAFPSLAVQTNVDRLTQMVIRLSDQMSRTIRAPDGDIAPAMLLPVAATRANTNLGFDSGGMPALNQQLIGTTLSQATIGSFLYPQTPSEQAMGIVPVYLFYPPGNVFRYGAKGDGSTDDSVAIQNAINVMQITCGSAYLPATTASYKVTVPLNVTAGVSIVGDGFSPYTPTDAGTRGPGSWLQFAHLGKGFTSTTGRAMSPRCSCKRSPPCAIKRHLVWAGRHSPPITIFSLATAMCTLRM